MFPVFITLALAENGLRLLRGKSILRTNDTIASIGQGIFQECIRFVLINLNNVFLKLSKIIYQDIYFIKYRLFFKTQD